MNSQDKAKATYLRITSYAPYSEMNGIPREWFEKKIEEALDEWGAEVILWALKNEFDFSMEPGDEESAKELYEQFIKESALK